MPQFDLKFEANDGTVLSFDLFPLAGMAPAPVVVCIHGGGWISGEPSMMHEVAESLNRMGFSAVCPQYRLAPLHTYPTPIEDIQACIRHLRANSNELQIDSGAIGVLGNSAGGYLAAMCGLQDSPIRGISSRANCVVDISGITDLSEPDDSHFPISMSFLEQFMGCSHVGNEEKWTEASPISHTDSAIVPFLIIHGESDEIVPIAQSQALAGKLFGAGADIEFHSLPGEGHSFSYPGWLKVESLFEEFLRKSLRHEHVA